MKKTKANIFLYLFVILIVGIVSSPSWSQECNQVDDAERFKCKSDKYNDKLDSVMEKMVNEDLGIFTENQKEALKNSKNRAKNESRRMKSEDFKNFGKKNNVDCYVQEVIDDQIGNDDGICKTKGPNKEDCEEVKGDQIGNDDGICEKKEICVEVCIKEDDDLDVDKMKDAETTLEDGLSLLEDLDMIVDNTVEMANIQQNYAESVITGDGEDSDECSNVYSGHERKFSHADIQGTLAASQVAKAIADGCRDGCTQTTFGFNCRAFCLAAGIAENALAAVAEGFELQDDVVTSSELDKVASCVEKLGSDSNQMQDDITEIRNLINDVIDLLNTPQGQRLEFPIK